MPVRKDKFQVGDVVIWDPIRGKAPTSDGSAYPDELVIKKVLDVPYEKGDFLEDTPSNWQGMGHTQFVWINDDPENVFSGAWFIKKSEASS